MICPDCGDQLQVYKTYHKSTKVTRQYRQCRNCKERHITDIHYVGRVGDRNTPIKSLTDWGVEPDRAKVACNQHPAKTIMEYADNLDFIIADYQKQTGKAVHSTSGFLLWCIDTHYDYPGCNGTQVTQPIGLGPLFDTPQQPEPATEQETLWAEVQQGLRRQMTQATYDAIIKRTWLIAYDGSQATIGVKTMMAKEWLENRLMDTVARALSSVVGHEVTLKFTILEESE